MKSRRFILTAAAVYPALLAHKAWGQADWPVRPIQMVIPFTPGGPTDVTGRVLADKLGQELKQSVVVVNKAGAAGNIGAEFAAHSKPDGYTIFFTTGGTQCINPFLYEKPGYDPEKDFEPVVWVTNSPNILTVNPSFPARTVAELIQIAKEQPGKLNSATPGAGSTPYMFGELFKRSAGIQIQNVTYKGSGPALVDVVGGHVPIMFDGIPSSLPLVQAGKLRALAVTGLQRSAAVPDIPTMAETIPGFDASGWFAVYVPTGTPKSIVIRLNEAINRVLQQPEVRNRYAQLGADVVGGSPEKLREQVQKELAKWSDLIKQTGMKADAE